MRKHRARARGLRLSLLLLLASVSLVALSGCNTVAGFGEDMEAAGEGLENSAEREKDY